MARPMSHLKPFSIVLSEEISIAVFRRRYAAAASHGAARARGRGTSNNKTKEETVGSTNKASWVPDPKTGYYRPARGTEEIDPAELRATLLSKHRKSMRS